MRLQDRPTLSRRRRGALHGFLHRGARGARDLRRPGSTRRTAASSIRRRRSTPAPADGSAAIMVLAFEFGRSSDVEPWMARALECCADHGGTPETPTGADAHRDGAAGVWRNAFIRMPYARERTDRCAASSTTRSRPRSPGSASRRSTTRSRPRPRTRSARRPDAPARSPAASPMSIRTGRRPISPSTRSDGTASLARSGTPSRAPASMR